jgi:tetratricopeptide (TPR) repeat protein
MNTSDAHLEAALEDCNARVNLLEPEGDSPELLEALVNRGVVLHMMGYGTSAMEDLESAYDMSDGMDVDPGLTMKMLATMACIAFESGVDPSSYYILCLPVLQVLKENSRYYDRKSLIRTLMDSVHDLLDSEQADLSIPFLMKAMSILEGSGDPWSRNRMVDVLNLMGEADDALNDPESAIGRYSEAIEIGTELMHRESLEDPDTMVLALVSRGEAALGLGRPDDYIRDASAAIELLEGMGEFRNLEDSDILVNLHQGIAGELIKQNRMEEAEMHLLKAVEIGIHGTEADFNGQE